MDLPLKIRRLVKVLRNARQVLLLPRFDAAKNMNHESKEGNMPGPVFDRTVGGTG
jgi:hypothetical protein